MNSGRQMFQTAAKKLISMVFNVFPLETHGLIRYVEMQKLNGSIARLEKLGLNIVTVFDIGANDGSWAKHLKRHVLKRSECILFEANAVHETALQRTGFQYFIAVLSSEERFVDFYSLESTGDSYFVEKTIHYADVVPKRVLTTTLDEIVDKRRLPKPDFLKIDTQGSEIDILLGGSKTLETTALVLVECPIFDYNVGAPDIRQYLDFFRSNDFVPIDLLQPHYKDDVLVQVDILFLRKEHYLKMFRQKELRHMTREVES